VLQNLLRRSGMYQALIDGEAPEDYCQRVVDRIQYGERDFSFFWLLGRCQFPRDRFELGGYSVVRLSVSEADSLGPDARARRDIFSDEYLPRELKQAWFLRRDEGIVSGFSGGVEWKRRSDEYFARKEPAASPELVAEMNRVLDADLAQLGVGASDIERGTAARLRNQLRGKGIGFNLIEQRTSEIVAGRRVNIDADPRLAADDDLATPLIILALYHHEFFDVPYAFVSDPGWRIAWLKREPIRAVSYRVSEEEWENFQTFAQLVYRTLSRFRFLLSSLQDSPHPSCIFARQYRAAISRYLRATFATGYTFFSSLTTSQCLSTFDSFETYKPTIRPDPDSLIEEALLQYVFALESALLGGNQTEGKSDGKKTHISDGRTSSNVGLKASELIGRDNQEKASILILSMKYTNSETRWFTEAKSSGVLRTSENCALSV
jgi:hypothetical protein